MIYKYSSSKIEKLCTNQSKLLNKYGADTCKELQARLDEFTAAETLQDIYKLGYPRLHWLKGDMAGCLAVDLDGAKRLILAPTKSSEREYKNIDKIVLLSIEKDYH